MANIRVFTSEPGLAREYLEQPLDVAQPLDVDVVGVSDLSSRPPGWEGGWPPVVVGFAPDLVRVTQEQSHEPPAGHVSLALSDPELLSTTEFQETVQAIEAEGLSADFIIGPEV